MSAILKALVEPRARQRLYNICMNEPVDYLAVARYLAETRGLPSIDIKSDFVSNWMDNARARAELGWRPAYDLERLIEASWTCQRTAEDKRKIWYPG